jgi:hypothetical protein
VDSQLASYLSHSSLGSSEYLFCYLGEERIYEGCRDGESDVEEDWWRVEYEHIRFLAWFSVHVDVYMGF